MLVVKRKHRRTNTRKKKLEKKSGKKEVRPEIVVDVVGHDNIVHHYHEPINKTNHQFYVAGNLSENEQQEVTNAAGADVPEGIIKAFTHNNTVSSRHGATTTTDRYQTIVRNPQTRLRVLFEFVLYCLCIMLGFVSIGSLWPERFRRWLLSHRVETAESTATGTINRETEECNNVRLDCLERKLDAMTALLNKLLDQQQKQIKENEM